MERLGGTFRVARDEAVPVLQSCDGELYVSVQIT